MSLSNPFKKSSSKKNEWEIIDVQFRERIDNLEHQIKETNVKLDRILQILTDNRTLYTNYIKQNHEITEKVISILEENRKIYLKAFDEVEDKENATLDKTKDLAENLKKQNEMLEKNAHSPFVIDRLYNHFWRTTAPRPGTMPLSMIGAGIPIINELMRDDDEPEV